MIPGLLLSGDKEVYLVLGSDTAIWSGMSTGRYHCTYNLDLYTAPSENAYRVMSEEFRSQFVDSYGQPLKMTWWMMAGNIFRFATNENIPVPNIMTLYLMKKYHGDMVQQLGDELSLHYHTFAWTDYDGDGMFWWNQSKTFNECRDDFDVTIAQFLLEEDTYPVSFRSGWHYMDNGWQHYLDELLPYSMHNDYPSKRNSTDEPINNVFDWSQAPSEWVPYHPSPENYQIPGDGPGWNVRSLYTKRWDQEKMDALFQEAQNGTDQVACIWSHLPEDDFPEQLAYVHDLAQTADAKFPDVSFRYCTAIEAMQRWLETTDSQQPDLIFEDQISGDDVTFAIETNEPIFQKHPIVAIKTIYEEYLLLDCEQIAPNKWQTVESLTKSHIAKAAVAVTDTVGNLITKHIRFLPDDIYIDNIDPGYSELLGGWTDYSESAWGLDSRIVTLNETDSAAVQWALDAPQAGYYNIFVQVPGADNAVQELTFHLYVNSTCIDTVRRMQTMPDRDWTYVSTAELLEGSRFELVMSSGGSGKLVADAAKISALVRDRDMVVNQQFIDYGEVSQLDTVTVDLPIQNQGYQDLTIYSITSGENYIKIPAQFPLTIPAMSTYLLPVSFCAPELEAIINDTLMIASNDAGEPEFAIPYRADVQSFFVIVDNEDSEQYQEIGEWHTSVAEAYGPSSRYAWLNRRPRAAATFNTRLAIAGLYEILEIVPKTVNASNYAVYAIIVDGVVQDSVVIDQNQGSGDWVPVGKYELPINTDIQVKVVDTGKNTNPNSVLRADAVKFALLDEATLVDEKDSGDMPLTYKLMQNYPNPFNSSTVFSYQIADGSHVTLRIYNSLGQQVDTVVDQFQNAGSHTITWNAEDLASGVYLYELMTPNFRQVRKFMYIR